MDERRITKSTMSYAVELGDVTKFNRLDSTSTQPAITVYRPTLRMYTIVNLLTTKLLLLHTRHIEY